MDEAIGAVTSEAMPEGAIAEANPADFGFGDKTKVEQPGAVEAKAPEVKAEEPELKAELEEGTKEAEVEADGKLLAGEFKTPEEAVEALLNTRKQLEQREIDYKNSSQEGLRLNTEVKRLEAYVEKTTEEMNLLKMQVELGTFQEKTPEELSQMESDERTKYYLAQDKFDRKKEALIAQFKAQDAEIEAKNQQLEATIEAMSKDTQRFPHFDKIGPQLDKLAEEAGMAGTGNPKAPLVLYWMQRGILADRAEREAAQAKSQADAEVKKKAVADASRSQVPGTTRGKVTSPGSISGAKTQGELSDQEAKVLAAYTSGRTH